VPIRDLRVARLRVFRSTCGSGLALALGTAALSAQEAGSPATTRFALPSNPIDLATGDFDLDGRPDLVAALPLTGSIAVLLGDGAGSIRSISVLGTGSSPRSLAVGDFDGDGRLDVATANESSSSATILVDVAGEVARSLVEIPDGRPYTIAAADLDGDGNLDLVVGCMSPVSGVLRTSMGDGAGRFSEGKSCDLPGYSRIAVGDLDRDGRPDVLVAGFCRGPDDGGACYVPYVLSVLGDGTGAFPRLVPSSFVPPTALPGGVAVADVDQDGRLDGLVSGGDLQVLHGDGAGRVERSSSVPLCCSPVDLAVGDLDGDGHLDVATADSTGDTVTLLRGDGRGGFSIAACLAAGEQPASIVIVDADCDGRPDVAIANLVSSDVSVIPIGRTRRSKAFLRGEAVDGCFGRLGIASRAPPALGASGFGITTTNAPRSARGIVVVSPGFRALDSEAELVPELVAAGPLVALDAASDPSGNGFAAFDIPATPSLAGRRLLARTLWPEACRGSGAAIAASRVLVSTME